MQYRMFSKTESLHIGQKQSPLVTQRHKQVQHSVFGQQMLLIFLFELRQQIAMILPVLLGKIFLLRLSSFQIISCCHSSLVLSLSMISLTYLLFLGTQLMFKEVSCAYQECSWFPGLVSRTVGMHFLSVDFPLGPGHCIDCPHLMAKLKTGTRTNIPASLLSLFQIILCHNFISKTE